MKRFRHIVPFFGVSLFLVLFLGGCTSAVRFANNPTAINTNKSRRAQNADYANELDRLNKYKSVDNPNINTIIKEAESWIGTKYCYGGESRICTDCSGFVQTVYGAANVTLPRTAAEQYDYTERISANDAQQGDLVFFKKGSTISHVGLYVGDGMMIHASTSNGVVLEKINKPAYLNCAGYGRVTNLMTVK